MNGGLWACGGGPARGPPGDMYCGTPLNETKSSTSKSQDATKYNICIFKLN